MKILHTEASPGWGGQELRILREAEGMRARGHHVILAIQKGGGLVKQAQEAGFEVIEISFKKSHALFIISKLYSLIRSYQIDLVNTHSSLDAWLGGVAAFLCRCPTVRTRHLSTPIRAGLNSYLLYNLLADRVVTTCESIVPVICRQAKVGPERCSSIPTGVDPSQIQMSSEEVRQFRERWGIKPNDVVAGTLCILRGWKGVSDLLKAAQLLKNEPRLKWLIVGSGVSEAHFHQEAKELGVQDHVIFTGHQSPPYVALAAMDIFLLLSWAHEGVSQASLQAAWLKKPLITTEVGGLPEVCVADSTGILVSAKDPVEVAEAVQTLFHDHEKRMSFGNAAHELVKKRFTLTHTLDQMEQVYAQLKKK